MSANRKRIAHQLRMREKYNHGNQAPTESEQYYKRRCHRCENGDYPVTPITWITAIVAALAVLGARVEWGYCLGAVGLIVLAVVHTPSFT